MNSRLNTLQAGLEDRINANPNLEIDETRLDQLLEGTLLKYNVLPPKVPHA